MTPGAFEKAALALPGATLSIQWGSDRVYKVGGKMFAVRADAGGPSPAVSFKCSDLSYEMLIQRKDIAPAPYMARAKWVMLKHLRALPDDEIRARLAEAHRLVTENLPRKLRTQVLQ
jgi:predicted DNA-binding protein (MmcQ/YjbR family)